MTYKERTIVFGGILPTGKCIVCGKTATHVFSTTETCAEHKELAAKAARDYQKRRLANSFVYFRKGIEIQAQDKNHRRASSTRKFG